MTRHNKDRFFRLQAIATAHWPGDCVGQQPSPEANANALVLAVAIHPHVPWILENIQRPPFIKKWRGIDVVARDWGMMKMKTERPERPTNPEAGPSGHGSKGTTGSSILKSRGLLMPDDYYETPYAN